MAIESQQRESLLQAAQQARLSAYTPYSKYKVGAALLTESGKIFTGVNVENAAYPVSICAERTAIFKAVSEGERKFSAIAVVTENGGSPCGSCRQVMAEFAPDMQVFIAKTDGTIDLETTVKELLPAYFGPGDLP
ncbi:MAG: cytidine deaminase [Anaerolineales bacterium]|nr:cytidine deaminase [Anaerolineales bacterium]